jgi:hypothetical protein
MSIPTAVIVPPPSRCQCLVQGDAERYKASDLLSRRESRLRLPAAQSKCGHTRGRRLSHTRAFTRRRCSNSVPVNVGPVPPYGFASLSERKSACRRRTASSRPRLRLGRFPGCEPPCRFFLSIVFLRAASIADASPIRMTSGRPRTAEA